MYKEESVNQSEQGKREKRVDGKVRREGGRETQGNRKMGNGESGTSDPGGETGQGERDRRWEK